MVWMEDRRRRAFDCNEDAFFSENVPQYPVYERLGSLLETHDILMVRVNPCEMGWPVRRPRVFIAALNRKTLVFRGPSHYQQIKRKKKQ